MYEAPTEENVSAQAGHGVPADDAAKTMRRRIGRLTVWDWVLVAYLGAVSVLTLVVALGGDPYLQALANSPSEAAQRGTWTIFLSGLIVAPPAVIAQIAMTAGLGVAAIRLVGGRVFWAAALVAHFLGTLVVYVGIWIVDFATPGTPAITQELDFGISLVWCAALGILTAVGWWSSWRLPAWLRYGFSFGGPVAIVLVVYGSTGLARYEHAAAYTLAVLVVFLCRRWAFLGRRLRLVKMEPV